MYESFAVTTIKCDTLKKQIVIDATSDFDYDSINESTVKLFERKSKVFVDYTFEVHQKRLTLTLVNWPKPNKEYVINISDVLNAIGDKLQQGVRKTIVFESSLCSVTNIVYPAHGESIHDLKVVLQEEPPEVEEDEEPIEPINCFYIEVSTDCNFHHIVKDITLIDRLMVDLPELEYGQYFIRARVQKGEEYGLWSEVVGFMLEDKDNPFDPGDDEDEDIFTDNIQIVTVPDHGILGKSILIELDCAINQDSLDNIVVIRRDY